MAHALRSPQGTQPSTQDRRGTRNTEHWFPLCFRPRPTVYYTVQQSPRAFLGFNVRYVLVLQHASLQRAHVTVGILLEFSSRRLSC